MEHREDGRNVNGWHWWVGGWVLDGARAQFARYLSCACLLMCSCGGIGPTMFSHRSGGACPLPCRQEAIQLAWTKHRLGEQLRT